MTIDFYTLTDSGNVIADMGDFFAMRRFPGDPFGFHLDAFKFYDTEINMLGSEPKIYPLKDLINSGFLMQTGIWTVSSQYIQLEVPPLNTYTPDWQYSDVLRFVHYLNEDVCGESDVAGMKRADFAESRFSYATIDDAIRVGLVKKISYKEALKELKATQDWEDLSGWEHGTEV